MMPLSISIPTTWRAVLARGIRQGRQPDTDLDDDVIGADLPGTDDGLGGMAVDQEVLTEFLLRGEMVFLQRGSGLAVD